MPGVDNTKWAIDQLRPRGKGQLGGTSQIGERLEVFLLG